MKPEELGVIAATGTDRQWWNATGNCGGCGNDTCHPGHGCTPGQDGCRYCPERTMPQHLLTPPAPKPEPDPNQGTLL